MIIRKLINIARQEQISKHPLRAAGNLARRLQWHLHWMLRPNSPIIQTLPDGMSIRLGRTSASYGMFLHRGYCDPELMETLYRYLRPGSVMFDCGAHIGEFTVAAAAAMEELPKTFEAWMRHMEAQVAHPGAERAGRAATAPDRPARLRMLQHSRAAHPSRGRPVSAPPWSPTSR